MALITRRRFIAISAAAIAPLVGGGTGHGTQAATWRGIALGASASIRIDGRTPGEAAGTLRACVREIARLEAVFSLYRADSALSRLNRAGMLRQPAPDLLAVLSTARGVHAATGGAFDPTVQPLWGLYARHFGSAGAAPAVGPSPEDIAATLDDIGLDKVDADPGEIRFRQSGMAMTLNGIAQGYITDRVADLLRAHGLSNVLVNIGEIRALGGQANGNPWKVGIPGGSGDEGIGRRVDLADRAIATSATSGTVFDEDGRYGHILDPRSGRPARARRQVSVIAPSAALADAYSTAFCLACLQDTCRAHRTGRPIACPRGIGRPR